MSESHDKYGKDFRDEPPVEYPKNPLTPAPQVDDEVDEEYFTGCTQEDVEPKIGEFPTAVLSVKSTQEEHRKESQP